MQTTLQTVDRTCSGVRRDLPGLNQTDVLPPQNLKGGNKAKEPEFCVSPFEQGCPNLSTHSIEAARVSEHGVFEEQRNLIPDEKKKRIILPENGMHEDTPYNHHLTDYFSQGSNAWLAPLQKQEKATNNQRKSSNFLTKFNLNSFNLGADLVFDPSISHFDLDESGSMRGLHLLLDLPTTNFSDKNEELNPLINIREVFASEDQDPSDN